MNTTETTQADPSANAPEAKPTFDALPLSDEVRRAILEVGYVHPTPVQVAAYEPSVEGKDLLVQARTGTGKTAAFGIPLVDRLVQEEGGVQALVLAPTRELALQSARELRRLGKYRNLHAAAVYGGAPMERQVKELKEGAQLVSGTPGRVLDHLRRGTLDASGLKVLVLDEADEMLSMGFAKELNAIIELLPKTRQTLLYSATVDESIQRVAARHMSDPVHLALSSDQVGAETIQHFVYMISGTGRVQDLIRVLEVEDPESAIIFCNMKSETEQVAAGLQQAGFNADWLNGDLPQGEREKVLTATRSGKLRFLVSTDVAARGIDISHLTHVINYSFPESIEQYIHRTGRTGRAGRTGTAISLVSPKELGNLYYLRLQYKIFPTERSLPTPGEHRTRLEADRLTMLDSAFTGQPSGINRAVARRLLTHVDAERLIAGLLGTFFGSQGDDVDEQAAAARRGRDGEMSVVTENERRESAPKSRKARGEGRGEARGEGRGEARGEGRGERSRKPRERQERRDERGRDEVEGEETESAEARTDDRNGRVQREDRREREDRGRREGRRDRERSDRDGRDRDSRGQAADREEQREAAPPKTESKDGDVHDDTPEDTTRLFFNVGRKDSVRAGDLGRLVREQCELEREDLGRIRVRDKHSFVEVASDAADKVVSALHGQTHFERELVVEPARA